MKLSRNEIDIINDYKRDIGLEGGMVLHSEDYGNVLVSGEGLTDMFKSLLSLPISAVRSMLGGKMTDGCKYCKKRGEMCDVCDNYIDENGDMTILEMTDMDGSGFGSFIKNVLSAPFSIAKSVLGLGIDLDGDELTVADVINMHDGEVEGGSVVDLIKQLVGSADKSEIIKKIGSKVIEKYGKKILGLGSESIGYRELIPYSYTMEEIEQELLGGDVLDIVKTIAEISPFSSNPINTSPLAELIGKDTMVNLSKQLFKKAL